MYSITTTVIKALVNAAKTFLAGYGVALAYDAEAGLTLAITTAALTGAVTAIRNWWKNSDK